MARKEDKKIRKGEENGMEVKKEGGRHRGRRGNRVNRQGDRRSEGRENVGERSGVE